MKKIRIISALLLATALLAFVVPVLSLPNADVDDSYTKSLLHFDGTDASTTITDESGKTWTASGNAQLDTAQQKFGTASLLLDGNGDYISTSDSDDFNPGSGDLTVDFWIRLASLPAASGNMAVWGQSSLEYFNLYNSAGTYQWQFYHNDGSTWTIAVVKNTSITTNTWYHIALVKSGTSYYIFQDGTQVGTTVTDSDPITDKTGNFTIGTRPTSAWYLNGWVDEFRFSKGVARWTSNFTPPTDYYFPTFTPTPTFTATVPTDTPTLTPTPTVPTDTPTVTPTATVPTNTPTHTTTATVPTSTVPTDTPTITPTVPSSTPEDTHTPAPIAYTLVPEITYGEYMTATLTVALCGVLVIGMVVIAMLLLLRRKGAR